MREIRRFLGSNFSEWATLRIGIRPFSAHVADHLAQSPINQCFLRKTIKARGHFPSDEAALKRIWLALRNVVAKWTGSRHEWKCAMTQFALLYPERFNIGI